MTIVTGSTLKTSLGTAETALDTLIGAPTIANRDAAVAALATVIADARQSRLIQSSDASSRRIHQDFVECADALRHDIVNSSAHHASATQPVGPASIFRSIKRTHLAQNARWDQYKNRTPTTD